MDFQVAGCSVAANGLFGCLGRFVDDTFANYATTLSSNLIEHLRPLMLVALTVYFMILAWRIMYGGINNIGADLFQRFLSIGLVTYIALNSGHYVAFAIEGQSAVEQMALSAFRWSGDGQGMTVWGMFDQMWSYPLQIVSDIFRGSQKLGWTDIAILLIYALALLVLAVLSVIYMGVFIFVILFARYCTTLGLGFGPLFICCLIFPFTRNLFGMWIGFLLTNIFILVGMTFVGGFFISVLSQIKDVLLEITNGVANKGALFRLVTLILFVLALKSSFIILSARMPDIAGKLVGFLSLASIAPTASSAGQANLDYKNNMANFKDGLKAGMTGALPAKDGMYTAGGESLMRDSAVYSMNGRMDAASAKAANQQAAAAAFGFGPNAQRGFSGSAGANGFHGSAGANGKDGAQSLGFGAGGSGGQSRGFGGTGGGFGGGPGGSGGSGDSGSTGGSGAWTFGGGAGNSSYGSAGFGGGAQANYDSHMDNDNGLGEGLGGFNGSTGNMFGSGGLDETQWGGYDAAAARNANLAARFDDAKAARAGVTREGADEALSRFNSAAARRDLSRMQTSFQGGYYYGMAARNTQNMFRKGADFGRSLGKAIGISKDKRANRNAPGMPVRSAKTGV